MFFSILTVVKKAPRIRNNKKTFCKVEWLENVNFNLRIKKTNFKYEGLKTYFSLFSFTKLYNQPLILFCFCRWVQPWSPPSSIREWHQHWRTGTTLPRSMSKTVSTPLHSQAGHQPLNMVCLQFICYTDTLLEEVRVHKPLQEHPTMKMNSGMLKAHLPQATMQ